MIQGFGDESEGKIFSLTACILEHEKWQALIEAWTTVLDEEPAIKHFHMREARNYDGQFRGFSQLKRDYKIIRLVDAIMKHRPRVITTWVVMAEHREIVGDRYAYELRTPYFFCFLNLLWWTAYESKFSDVKLPVDFTFDDKGDIGEHAVKWFGYAKAAAPLELLPFFGATPVFRNDEKMIPLQIADLVAWHIHRKLEVPGSDPERAASERLDGLLNVGRQLDSNALKAYINSLGDLAARPLGFLMAEKPSRRNKIWKGMQKQHQRKKKKMQNQNPEFTNFDLLATEVLHATKAQLARAKAKLPKKGASQNASGRTSSKND